MSMATLIKEDFMGKEKENTESKMDLTALKPDDETPVKEPDPTKEPKVLNVVAAPNSSKQGVIHNCLALNVRSEADVTGKVVTILSKDVIVTINESTSTDAYYNVTTQDEIVGFCKKEYIKLI